MTLPKRDTQYHTFGDYLVWSRNSGDELIDGNGTAYIKESPGVEDSLTREPDRRPQRCSLL